MYIYLDESKGFFWEKKKIVFWWLLTNLRPSTIDKLYYEFLDFIWVKEKWWEIKSNNKKYKDKILDFYKFLKNKKEYKNIEFIWAYCDNYEENWLRYSNIVANLFARSLKDNKFNLDKVRNIDIISDMLKLSYSEENIRDYLKYSHQKLQRKFSVQKISFTFVDSKRYWWIKFADFIAWILRKKYIWWEDELEYEFTEMFVWSRIFMIKIK